jgi:hypothetical protein
VYSIAPFIPPRLGEIAAPGRVGHLGTSSTTLPRRAFVPDVWPGRALQDGGSRSGRRHRSLRMQQPDCAVRRAFPDHSLPQLLCLLRPESGDAGCEATRRAVGSGRGMLIRLGRARSPQGSRRWPSGLPWDCRPCLEAFRIPKRSNQKMLSLGLTSDRKSQTAGDCA